MTFLNHMDRRHFIHTAMTGVAMALVGFGAASARADEPIKLHPDNSRCFVYRGKPMKILTSAEHYGAVINAEFDYDVYLDEMQRTGQNQTRVFTFFRNAGKAGITRTLFPSAQASVLPWPRVSGKGQASDGLDKFDLERWNPAYFARLKDYVRKCAKHGVICEIVLFCNPYTLKRWELYPCSAGNNVNGVGTDVTDWRAFMTLDAPSIVRFQERLARKLVTELNGFDNVYYEICNESWGKKKQEIEKIDAWHKHLAALIRLVEKDLPKRHLIAANVNNGATMKNADIDILNLHYPPARTWQFMRRFDRYPKPIVFDEDSTFTTHKTPQHYAVNRALAWSSILSGAAGYGNLDLSFTTADETGTGKALILGSKGHDGVSLRKWFAVFRNLLDDYDVAKLVPAVGVIAGDVPGCTYAATTDGKGSYILYFVDERFFPPNDRFRGLKRLPRPPKPGPRARKVALKLPAGRYDVRSFDPKTSKTAARPQLRSDGSSDLTLLKTTEFDEDIAVLLRRIP